MIDTPRIVEWIDGEQVTREMTPEEIAALPPPPSPPVPISISRRQAAYGMLMLNMISPDEAVAMAQRAEPPAFLMAFIGKLPERQLAFAKLDFAAAEYFRDAPLLELLMFAADKSDAETDDFFRMASTL